MMLGIRFEKIGGMEGQRVWYKLNNTGHELIITKTG